MIYDSSTRFTESGSVPYKNSMSTIRIQINDGVDTENPTYDINLSSTSVFDPNRIQTGTTLCFPFYNNDPRATKIEQTADSLCMKYGVGFYIKKRGESDLIKLESNEIPAEFKPVITPDFPFKGYYYNYNGKSVQIVDKDMKIKISTNYFDKTTEGGQPIRFEGVWES